MIDLDAEDFLEIVYGDKEGWVDLPAKVGSYWVPFHTEWPADGSISRRIDSSLRDREDLYYSVATFSERGRKIEDVLPTAWLWADLDEVHPSAAAKLGFLPTVAVQSSPGRYQALWRLDRELKPGLLEKLNRALSYALDADKGGWDLTQVLRIPGTRNFKYATAPMVELMWYKPDLVYNPGRIWRKLKEIVPAETLANVGKVDIPRAKDLPARAKQLLRTTSAQVVEGERSARMWELECMLVEAGLTESEIFDLVWSSAWNKWAGIRTGRQRLEREIRKAVAHVSRRLALRDSAPTTTATKGAEGEHEAEDDEDSDDGVVDDGERLPFVRYSSFMAMSMEAPRWLVKDIWTAGSHGIIGGEPKTSKTTIALALAVSVASGQPFLGRYPVSTPGPVLFVQEENAPWMIQDRARKIAASAGLIRKRDALTRPARRDDLARKGRVVVELDFPEDLPLRFLNNFGYDLDVEEHREMLEAEVAEIRPALVILDPLYLILGSADLDKAREVRPFLKWLMHLRYEYQCAIALVHHFRKSPAAGNASGWGNGGGGRAGQRMLGSTTFHGWSDSALYCTAREVDKAGWIGVRVETEFRSMAPQKPLDIEMTLGEPGDLTFEAEVLKFDMQDHIYKTVRESCAHGGVGVTLNQLAEIVGLDRRVLLSRCRGDDRLVVETGARGRGHSHRVTLATSSPGGESGDEG